MSAPLSLSDVLEASRLFELRQAVVAGLKTLIAGVEVRAHAGKIDLSDVVAEDTFVAPSILVALTKFTVDPRLSGSEDDCAHLAAYVIVEDTIVDGKRVERDEIGPAICDAIAHFLSQPNKNPMWGLEDVGLPEDIAGQPVFTAKTFARGMAFYAVTWRQELFARGVPMFGEGDDV